MPQVYYKGAIWTNHALLRLSERGLTQEIAGNAFNHPDKSMPGTESGTMRYQKRFGISLVTVVAKQNEKSEWIVLSCWADPPLPGSNDERRQKEYQRYKKATFWKKIWITALRQLGLSKF